MKSGSALALALCLAVPTLAFAQDAPVRAGFDVMAAANGVWAYDPLEVEEHTDFTCAERPMALRIIDGGARVAAMRPGEPVRYALVLDVRNDFPIGPTLAMVWQDAPNNAAGEHDASVLVMDSEDGFYWIEGPELSAFQDGAHTLRRSPRRIRCDLAPIEEEAAAE